jgi:hypothetical protein
MRNREVRRKCCFPGCAYTYPAMSTNGKFDLAMYGGRWRAAAETTAELLRQNDLLMEEQALLRRQRLQLLRELVSAARTFVDVATVSAETSRPLPPSAP